MGAETLVVPRSSFNHGLTREAARKALNSEIIVMMTPDAYPCNAELLSKLIRPLLLGQASIAYARQIPHEKSGFFSSFARSFNYPDKSEIRSLSDLKSCGPYTFFCSNSCAAYDNRALERIGGFSEALIGEDALAAAKILRSGGRIAYVAEACVRHSHDYTLLQEFKRHFDTGLFRREQSALLASSKDQGRGAAYARALFAKMAKEALWKLPYGLLHLICKWAGYEIGRRGGGLPLLFKKALSSQDYYWESSPFISKERPS